MSCTVEQPKCMRIFLLSLIFVSALSGKVFAMNEGLTELDRKLQEANADASKRSDYYHVFLNSKIFIPTYDIPKENKEARAQGGESIKPIIIKADGKKYLMLFDTEKKLSAWAKREVGLFAVTGYVLFDIFKDPSLTWILNYGTEYAKVFSPEEVKEIRDFLESDVNETIVMKKGAQVGIGEPEKIPNGMEEALSKIARFNSEIKAIYLGSIIMIEEDQKPHFAVVLQADTDSEVVKNSIREAIGVSVRKFIPKDEFIDILFDEGDSIAKNIIEKAKLIYQK